MGRVEGKVAILTGGAMGTGRASAILLAGEGATVVIADIMDKDGEQTAQDIKRENGKAVFRHLDVGAESGTESVYRWVYGEFGRIDILVNNAGITGVRKPTHEITKRSGTG